MNVLINISCTRDASKYFTFDIADMLMKFIYKIAGALVLILYFSTFNAQAQERLYRCGNEFTNKMIPGRECRLIEGGNVTVVRGSDDEPKKRKKPASNGNGQEIGIKDFSNLKAEAQKNIVRFDKKYKNSAFSAKALVSSVNKSAEQSIRPGYLVAFKSEGVQIDCHIKDQKSLDFVSKLDVGDVVNIKATFEGGSSLTSNGFLFVYSCILSK